MEALAYWHWIGLGILLSVAEIFVMSFALIWFGISALIVGVLMLVFPTMSTTVQVGLWAVFSAGSTALWFYWINPKIKNKTLSGLSAEAAVGKEGTIITYNPETKEGVIRFVTPLLGDSEWRIVCESHLKIGEKARVVQISGNHLEVKKI